MIVNTRQHIVENTFENSESKPSNAIENIIDAVTPFADSFSSFRGENLRFSANNKQICYLLHSGSVTLNRRGDGLIINSEQAPAIFGVANQLVKEDNLYLRVMEDSQISKLTLERFNLVIESSQLWKNLCKSITYSSSRVYDHCTRISQMTATDLIRFQLNELMIESEMVRNSITAANYIRNRTYLSRSNIMRILAELRDSEAITLRRGILISINNAFQ